VKLKFLGAAHTVTGSRTLCQNGSERVLIDCGLFQGPKKVRDLNWLPFPDAHLLNSIILTHAHIDHSGFLPRVVKDGFKGSIYCSPATRDLCEILLTDAAHLQEEDALFANQSGYSYHQPAYPLFTTNDAKQALRQFYQVPRNQWNQLGGNTMSFRLLRSGHILGSSFVELNVRQSETSQTILFSGDLGSGRSRILKPPVTGLEADYLVLESTYGNRIQNRTPPEDELAVIINRVCGRGGVLVIPAFSVGRTQEVLFLIRELERQNKIARLPVYVDSPMANRATDIFLKHTDDHQLIFDGDHLDSPLCPSCFVAARTAQDSIILGMKEGPMIILSAAGMLTGGRVMHHLKRRLPDERNAVLFVGYQAEETKGRLLQSGIKEIRIHHQTVAVKAEILTLDGLSAHADAQDAIEWIKGFRRLPKKIFINHGDNGAPEALAARIHEMLGIETVIPEQGEEFQLWPNP
jgi:metallo-beta-lactamase family protein